MKVTQYRCPKMGPFGAWILSRQCESNRTRYKRATSGKPHDAIGAGLSQAARMQLAPCATCPGAQARHYERRTLEIADRPAPPPEPTRDTTARPAPRPPRKPRPQPPPGYVILAEAAKILGLRNRRYAREKIRAAGVPTFMGSNERGLALYVERAAVERLRDASQEPERSPDEVTAAEAGALLGIHVRDARRLLDREEVPRRKTKAGRGGAVFYDRVRVEALARAPTPKPKPAKPKAPPCVQPKAYDEVNVVEAAAILGMHRKAARRRLLEAGIPHRKRNPEAKRGRAAGFLFRRSAVEALRDERSRDPVSELRERVARMTALADAATVLADQDALSCSQRLAHVRDMAQRIRALGEGT